jgi:pimeloyl-ACP methyl ester carboxylesterase
MLPRTRYARAGDVHIAYQVVGDGPFDLVFVGGIISHLDLFWEQPHSARFFERLASFSRLIVFDKRGLGISDRPSGWAPLEERMDDLRAVMDAAGSESAAIFGASEGGPLAILFAAAHPERCRSLALFGTFARMCRADDYPIGISAARMLKEFEEHVAHWGEPALLRLLAPTLWADPAEHEAWGRFERSAASPGAILAAIRMNSEIDVRHVLPQIHVPTLVLHKRRDRAFPFAAGRYLAERIDGARFVELPGKDHAFWVDFDGLLDEVQEFFTGARVAPATDRVLATVLFTDIVDSTRRAAELGDRRWAEILERHHAVTRRHLVRFRGDEVGVAGDGFLATFDGPARAIRCACAIRAELAALGIEIRAGLHAGECERIGGKLGGIAVHIGARVAQHAAAGEVLVSGTVSDLVAGSGIEFADRGHQPLKGVPGVWRLLAVANGA